MARHRRVGLTGGLLSVLFAAGCGGSPEFVFSLSTPSGSVVSFIATTTDPEVLTAAREELDRSQRVMEATTLVGTGILFRVGGS